MKLIMKTSLTLFTGLIFVIALMYSSCMQESKERTVSSESENEALNVVNDYVILGCFDEMTGEGELKYSVSVINQVVAYLLDDGSIISNSTLIKEYDSIAGSDIFYIKSDYTLGANEKGAVGITLDIDGSDLISTVVSCVHKCTSNGDCICDIWNLSKCNSHSCVKNCGIGETGGCSSSIETNGIVITSTTVSYINNQTPEC